MLGIMRVMGLTWPNRVDQLLTYADQTLPIIGWISLDCIMWEGGALRRSVKRVLMQLLLLGKRLQCPRRPRLQTFCSAFIVCTLSMGDSLAKKVVVFALTVIIAALPLLHGGVLSWAECSKTLRSLSPLDFITVSCFYPMLCTSYW